MRKCWTVSIISEGNGENEAQSSFFHGSTPLFCRAFAELFSSCCPRGALPRAACNPLFVVGVNGWMQRDPLTYVCHRCHRSTRVPRKGILRIRFFRWTALGQVITVPEAYVSFTGFSLGAGFYRGIFDKVWIFGY